LSIVAPAINVENNFSTRPKVLELTKFIGSIVREACTICLLCTQHTVSYILNGRRVIRVLIYAPATARLAAVSGG
jgi:hypothetical protein